VATKNDKLPGTAVQGGATDRQTQHLVAQEGMEVSEILSERAAAPSPFGDDQTFPLPVERLTYISSTPA
jgi:hypothetical protein